MYFLPQISVNVVKILVGLQDERDLAKLETLVWDPNNPLQEQHVDQFLVIARYHEIASLLDLYFSLTNFFALMEVTWLVAQMECSWLFDTVLHSGPIKTEKLSVYLFLIYDQYHIL